MTEKVEIHTDAGTEERFRDIWMYCIFDHEKGTLPFGPCTECVIAYAKTGPPDGKWNSHA